jgi:hypothetical protein
MKEVSYEMISDEETAEDRSEGTIVDLGKKVGEAEKALLEWLRKHGDEELTPRRLQREIQNGFSPSVTSIAFWQLVNRGQITLDSAGQVHRGAPSAAA